MPFPTLSVGCVGENCDGSGDGVVVFGFLSRWAPMKGLGLLLDAIPSVLARAPHSVFLIGGGDTGFPAGDAAFRQLIHSYGFPEQARYARCSCTHECVRACVCKCVCACVRVCSRVLGVCASHFRVA